MFEIKQKLFGFTADGDEVHKYTFTNGGIIISVLDLGGIICSLQVADRQGELTDIVLGYDTVYDYQRQTAYMGAIIGRCANRIQNAAFKLNDSEYHLYANDNGNHLHGGRQGFDKKIWQAKALDNGLQLNLVSPDKEEGYPGNLKVCVKYILQNDDVLKIEYTAVCDADTVCNLTNHAYFNLSKDKSADIKNQEIQLFASNYSPTDRYAIPIGTLCCVDNTPMDLRVLTPIGANINSSFEQIVNAKGFDHNYAIDDYDGTLRQSAYAQDKQSGITMCQYTTLPGVQFYTGNYIQNTIVGKNGNTYNVHSGFCLETQYFPNAINIDGCKKPVLQANTNWQQTTVYKFGILQ